MPPPASESQDRAATRPPRPQAGATSHTEFISAVQELGELQSADEAERAATAVLSELGGCLAWPVTQNLTAYLPRSFRELVGRRSFESSMSRFSAPAFVRGVADQERVDRNLAARHTRAVLLALDRTMPGFLMEQVHRELAAVWPSLTLTR